MTELISPTLPMHQQPYHSHSISNSISPTSSVHPSTHVIQIQPTHLQQQQHQQQQWQYAHQQKSLPTQSSSHAASSSGQPSIIIHNNVYAKDVQQQFILQQNQHHTQQQQQQSPTMQPSGNPHQASNGVIHIPQHHHTQSSSQQFHQHPQLPSHPSASPQAHLHYANQQPQPISLAAAGTAEQNGRPPPIATGQHPANWQQLQQQQYAAALNAQQQQQLHAMHASQQQHPHMMVKVTPPGALEVSEDDEEGEDGEGEYDSEEDYTDEEGDESSEDGSPRENRVLTFADEHGQKLCDYCYYEPEPAEHDDSVYEHYRDPEEDKQQQAGCFGCFRGPSSKPQSKVKQK